MFCRNCGTRLPESSYSCWCPDCQLVLDEEHRQLMNQMTFRLLELDGRHPNADTPSGTVPGPAVQGVRGR